MNGAGALVLSIAALGGAPRGEVLDFTATWCGPCQQMSPVVERLKRQGYPIRKVDVDQNKDLAKQYGVSGIPCFVLVVDGKPVNRIVGLTTENQLKRLVAQIPATSPPAANIADSSGRSQDPQRSATPTRTSQPSGQPRQSMPRPSEMAAAPRQQAEPKVSSGIKLPLFGKLGRSRQEPVVRGNNADEAVAEVPQDQGLLNRSARIRVRIGGQVNLGSGTIIDSRPGRTLIVSCAHIFEAAEAGSKIEVDLFSAGEPQTYVASLIRVDPEADVGLIAVPTDVALPSVAVAGSGGTPKAGDRVVSVGCSGGEVPSREQLTVTAINPYDGPANLECSGLPVEGRSGGGLFSSSGEIVGICIAADAERQRGVYAGLGAIHGLLDQCELSSLYSAAPATSVAQAESFQDPSASIPPVANPEVPTTAGGAQATGPMGTGIPQAIAAGQETTPPAADQQAPVNDEYEVVCILKSRTRPNAPTEVIVINEASPKFLSFLRGEIGRDGSPVTNRQAPGSSVNGVIATTAQRPLSRPMLQMSKSSLQLTGLKTPAPRRRYVRSKKARLAP